MRRLLSLVVPRPATLSYWRWRIPCSRAERLVAFRGWHFHQQRVHRPLRLCEPAGKVPRHHGSVLLFRFQPTTGPRCSDEANTRDREGLQLGLAADHHVRRKPTVFKQQGDWRQRQLEHGVRRQSRLLSIRHPACARGPREHRPVCIRLSKATVGAFASMRSSTFGKHRFWLAQI